MESITLAVSGMSCGGCVNSIQNALNAKDGVRNATADLDRNEVHIEFDPGQIEQPALIAAIETAGFDVTS